MKNKTLHRTWHRKPRLVGESFQNIYAMCTTVQKNMGFLHDGAPSQCVTISMLNILLGGLNTLDLLLRLHKSQILISGFLLITPQSTLSEILQKLIAHIAIAVADITSRSSIFKFVQQSFLGRCRQCNICDCRNPCNHFSLSRFWH
ncbi:hypothetical protein CEXT_642771 [Caerostris extrusa]|uniref:Uncharacterized protein n=1 Tax=Caerostris extrusa TaxID=172846 RepID=A0AAV4M7W0_CAEEX|nr:hypothetical protein CEXT_642771 [Caerostris extrusa]